MRRMWTLTWAVILTLAAGAMALDDLTIGNTYADSAILTAAQLNADNDSCELWAARTNDTLDLRFMRFADLSSHDSTLKYLAVDTIRSHPNVDSLGGNIKFTGQGTWTKAVNLDSIRSNPNVDSLGGNIVFGGQGTWSKAVNLDSIRSKPDVDSIQGKPYIDSVETAWIGVGTGTPSGMVDVASAANAVVNVTSSGASNKAQMVLTGSAQAGGGLILEGEGASMAGTYQGLAAADATLVGSYFASGMAIGPIDAVPMALGTNNTQRVLLDGNGDSLTISNVTGLYAGSTAATFSTVNTGQGANELYDMDQNVLTTSDVTFNSLTTGTYAADTVRVKVLDLWNGAENAVPICTLSSGSLTPKGSFFKVWPEGGASLDTILYVDTTAGWSNGKILMLRTVDASHDIAYGGGTSVLYTSSLCTLKTQVTLLKAVGCSDNADGTLRFWYPF